MSTLYVVLAVIVGIIVATITFVVIGAIEKHRKVNINWAILMIAIVLACILAMVLIYHNQHDIAPSAVQNAYEQGVKDGKSSEHHTLPTNSEMEEWFSSTEEVVVGTNGTDTAVHIIDHNGDEWVLYADRTQTK